MNHIILGFIKFGSEKNMLDLYEKGTVFLNPIQYFRSMEDQELRGDKYEGISEIINSLPGTLKIPGIDREFKYEKLHLRKSYDQVLGNIYSLFSISERGYPDYRDFKIDEKVKRFGSHGLLIDPKSFIDRMESKLNKLQLSHRHGWVDYYDKDNTSKKLSLFEKPLEFEYQKEFRFYVENTKIEPIVVELGSLETCAELFKMEDIFKLELKPKELI